MLIAFQSCIPISRRSWKTKSQAEGRIRVRKFSLSDELLDRARAAGFVR